MESNACNTKYPQDSNRRNHRNTAIDPAAATCNKEIPKIIQAQVQKALSYYPTLRKTRIRFVFTQKLNSSVMAARPVVRTLLGPRRKRMYEILISPVFKLKNSIEPIHQVNDKVLVGWIGHELGHIMDYERRSTLSIARFGILYGLSKRYIRRAERVADTFAVQHGMGSYILATKEFILGHSGLPQGYKDKIASLYLSPDDIVELVSALEESHRQQRARIIEQEAELAEEISQQRYP